jgi:hypothetical protein
MEDKVKVIKQSSGYSVMLVFEDELSAVVGGTIKRGAELLKTFDNNLALFTVDAL